MAFPRKIRLRVAEQVEVEELDRVEVVGSRVLLLLDGKSPFINTRLGKRKGIDADQACACGKRRLSGIPASLPLSGSRSITPSEERKSPVVVCDDVQVGLKLSSCPILRSPLWTRSGFVVDWALNYVTLLALGLAFETMLSILTAKFLPLFLIVWIILNISKHTYRTRTAKRCND